MAVTVDDNPGASRYEIRVDGEVGGVAVYRLAGDRIVFLHTEIEPAHEGEGLGGRLARGALDDARARELAVVALCPFIAGWIERHPEYADLLSDEGVP